jgi:hypothetical protein
MHSISRVNTFYQYQISKEQYLMHIYNKAIRNCLPSLLAIAGVGLSSGVYAAPIDLIANGGFETTSLSNSGQITQTNVSGWSNTVGSGGRGFYDYIFFPGTADHQGALDPNGYFKLWGPGTGSNNGLTATSPTGGNFLAADGDSQYNSPITQIVTGLTIGQTYDLSFYYAGAQQSNRTGVTTEAWQVSLGNQTQSTPTLTNANHGFTGWQQIDMLFTATSAQELLSFLAIGTPNGLPPMSLLDGVSLKQVINVPEPGALTLVGLGLLGMGAVRRKKSKGQ